MIETEFLSQLKRFSLIVNKRITSSFVGSKKSTMLGRGLIISDFRQYSPGDDIRAIDWNIYARSDNFFVKRYEEEKNLTVHVLIDTSLSMDYGTSKQSKFEYAAMLGLGFAYLASKENSRFYLSTFAKDIDTYRAKRGVNQILSFLNHLNTAKCSGVLEFKKLLKLYKNHVTSKSMIILISDFLFDIEELKQSLFYYKKHDLKVIQVLDRSELDLNIKGDFILKDSETNKEMEVYVTEKKKIEYRDKLYKHMLEIEKECGSVGAKYHLFSTQEPLFDAFYKILS